MGREASGNATGGSGSNRVSIIKTALYPFIAASVCPRLSPAHLGRHRHAARVPGPHDNPSPGSPRPPGPRPAARRAGRTSGRHTCPAPLRTRLPVRPVHGPMRASKLVARPVTLRPETLQAGPPRATATPNAGQGRGPALTLNGLLRSGSAKGLLSKSDIAPALRVTHPSPAPRHRRGEAAAPLRAHVAAAAAQIRVQLAGHRAGRATEHARCGGGPRRPAIRPSLPAWICAPGSASDRRASAGGGQVTSPGLWTHLARLGEGVVACVGEARARRSHVAGGGDDTWRGSS